jgi:hypothetical protein
MRISRGWRENNPWLAVVGLITRMAGWGRKSVARANGCPPGGRWQHDGFPLPLPIPLDTEKIAANLRT